MAMFEQLSLDISCCEIQDYEKIMVQKNPPLGCKLGLKFPAPSLVRKKRRFSCPIWRLSITYLIGSSSSTRSSSIQSEMLSSLSWSRACSIVSMATKSCKQISSSSRSSSSSSEGMLRIYLWGDWLKKRGKNSWWFFLLIRKIHK